MDSSIKITINELMCRNKNFNIIKKIEKTLEIDSIEDTECFISDDVVDLETF